MQKEKFLLAGSDIDSFGNAKMASLFRFFQDVATIHITNLGASHEETIKQNLLWVVIRIDVKLYEPIKNVNELIVSTHAGENKGFLYERYPPHLYVSRRGT